MRQLNRINKLCEEVLDRVYPSDLYCICCGKIIDWSRTYRLCDDCMNSIKWVTGRTCSKCGKAISKWNSWNSKPDLTSQLCYNCRQHEHSFDRGFCCTEYGMDERTIIYSLKYDDRTDIARTMGEIMADRMLAEFSIDELLDRYDLIVPVPITKKKRLIRGYNQAGLIAEYFAEHTGLRYAGEVLQRISETAAMKGLSPDERRKNIAGNFEVIEERKMQINGTNCIVLDDIYTTGATIDEIARTLKKEGARRVDFISFSSGADMIKS